MGVQTSVQSEISAAISTLTAGVGGIAGNCRCAFFTGIVLSLAIVAAHFLKGIVFPKLVRKFPQRAFAGLSQARWERIGDF